MSYNPLEEEERQARATIDPKTFPTTQEEKPPTLGVTLAEEERQARLSGSLEYHATETAKTAPYYPDPIVTIERVFSTRLNEMRTRAEVFLVEAARLKKQDKHFQAGLQVSLYTAARVSVGAVEGLTLPFRPIAIAQTVRGLIDLTTSAESREKFQRGVAADPVGFVAEVAGGYLGASVSPLKIKRVKKPSSKPPTIESPASLQPRGGGWPTSGSGGFGKSRASVTLLVRPQLKELPKIPSYIDPVALTLSSGVGLRFTPRSTPIAPSQQFKPVQVQKYEVLDPSKLGSIVKGARVLTSQEQKQDQIRITRPLTYPLTTPIHVPPVHHPPDERIFPLQTLKPLQIVTQLGRQRTRQAVIPAVILMQTQGQVQGILPMPRMRQRQIELTALNDTPPRIRKRRKKAPLLKLDIWGEMREYELKLPKGFPTP